MSSNKNSKTAEVILSSWEVQAANDNGEWETMETAATKGEALQVSARYLASGCAVRVRWAV